MCPSLLVTIALAAGLSLAGCTDAKKPVPSSTPIIYPSSEATNASTVFLTEAIVTTRIHSGRIVSWADNDSAWAWTIDVDFYNYEGKHTSKLRADSALVREKVRLFEGFGNVRIVTDDGRTLDRKSTRLNSSHIQKSRMPSSA